MGTETKIEWTDHTFNPWRGCSKVSPGCDHCYAETMSKRNPGVLGVWGDAGTRVVASESYWKQPLKWDRQSATDGVRRRVFCASLADVFEAWLGPISVGQLGEVLSKPGLDRESGPENWVPAWPEDTVRDPQGWRLVTLDDVRRRLFALIDCTPNLDWILLTKRPENIRRMWPVPLNSPCRQGDGLVSHDYLGDRCRKCDGGRRENVWLLTSVENQEQADKRIPELLECRNLSPVLGLSCEPLLGPVILPKCRELDWVIVGGESGPNARAMHPDWARGLRDQCQDAGVPFFFKQWGEWWPMDQGCGDPDEDCKRQFVWVDPSKGTTRNNGCEPDALMLRLGKKQAGHLLDGDVFQEFPLMRTMKHP